MLTHADLAQRLAARGRDPVLGIGLGATSPFRKLPQLVERPAPVPGAAMPSPDAECALAIIGPWIAEGDGTRLERLLDAFVSTSLLFTELWTGAAAWTPPLPLDAAMRSSLRGAVRLDHGAGHALGHAALDYLARSLRARERDFTDFDATERLGAVDGEAEIARWQEAARRMAAPSPALIEAWAAARRAALGAGGGLTIVRVDRWVV